MAPRKSINIRFLTVSTSDFIFGIRPILEALNSNRQIDKLFIQKDAQGELIQELLSEAKSAGVFAQRVPVEKLNRITRKNHQGAVAFISPVEFTDLNEVVTRAYENGEKPFVLLLDGITDVRNFGAISRTAEAAGVHALVIPQRGAASVNADAVKTSAGALFKIPVCKVTTIRSAIHDLQQFGIEVYGASEKAADYPYKIDLNKPVGLVMGNEESGLQDDVIRSCTGLVQIPMNGQIGSLNVSVAAGILMYEIVRQRL